MFWKLYYRGRKICCLIKDCSTNMWHVIYTIKGRSNAPRIIVLEINRCTILLILGNCIFMEAIQYRKFLIYTKIVVNKCVLFSIKNQLLEFICILNSVQSVNICVKNVLVVYPVFFIFLCKYLQALYSIINILLFEETGENNIFLLYKIFMSFFVTLPSCPSVLMSPSLDVSQPWCHSLLVSLS